MCYYDESIGKKIHTYLPCRLQCQCEEVKVEPPRRRDSKQRRGKPIYSASTFRLSPQANKWLDNVRVGGEK